LSGSASLPEDIRVVDSKDIPKTISGVISNLKKSLDCYFDSKSLSMISIMLSSNAQKILELKSRGAKLRCITEITRDNLSKCNEIMKNFELFHTSCLTGSFLIADGHEYLGYLTDGQGAEKLLHINNSSFVVGQQFLIDTMIDKALPANQRIIEIGRGSDGEFIETLKDPTKTKSLMIELMRSAIYEIAILFSTKNSFVMAEREGILEEIARISERGIKVKILVMKDETVDEISGLRLKAFRENIQVNYLLQFLPTKITTIIVDQIKSLTIEVNDDTKETFQEAIGLSTYSNSESTVFSNASIFESFWIQSELEKQNKARHAYFQVFKGFKLRDEIYSRRWSSNLETEETTNEKS
jgi:hypothetical protein